MKKNPQQYVERKAFTKFTLEHRPLSEKCLTSQNTEQTNQFTAEHSTK